jgi:EmrB/QacA subfamily drug resistance transporter
MNTTAKLDPTVVRTAWALLVGALAVVFDTTIVSIALPTLARELNAPISTIQWVSTAYLLALGVVIPVVGWAQRRFGGKRLWMLALTIFLIGSVLCSLAWDAPSLIGFRVIQGVGGGMMLPLLSTIMMQAARGQNLGRIMAVVSLPIVLGPILGPVLGGLILNNLHWSWLFWVNVPFCVVGLVLAALLLPKDEAGTAPRLDWFGLVLLSPALVGLLYGLSNVTKDGGFARFDVYAPLIAGAALLIGFVFWAIHRRERALIDVRLFRHRPLTSSTLLLFLCGISLYGAMLLLPLYLQEVRDFDVLTIGLLLIPQGVGTLLSRALAGRLSDRFGARWVAIVGFTIVLLGTLPFAFTDATTSVWVLMAALLLRGVGLGAVTIPIMAVAFEGLEHQEIPEASIVTRIAIQVGGSFGIAALAVVLQTAAVGATSIGDAVHAFNISFWWAIGFTAVAVGLSFLLPNHVRRATAGRDDEARDEPQADDQLVEAPSA